MIKYPTATLPWPAPVMQKKHLAFLKLFQLMNTNSKNILAFVSILAQCIYSTKKKKMNSKMSVWKKEWKRYRRQTSVFLLFIKKYLVAIVEYIN